MVACGTVPNIPVGNEFPVPRPPDYSLESNWAALPQTRDMADRTPGDRLRDLQATAPADVFYVHPTIYFKARGESELWNASLTDDDLNASVDESAILNQASIFNAAGRVFAPRYRQAHIKVFYPEGRGVSRRALDTAYADVLAAFDYYLEHWNDGRPIVIASHSQGTTHCKRLLADRFDGKPLRKQLVVAYLVGIPVSSNAYPTIPVCENATQTGCFVSWRTYRQDFKPKVSYRDTVPAIAVVNPLNWTSNEMRAPATLNKGGVLYNYDAGPIPGLVWTERRGDGLFTNKPKFFGDIFFTRKNYHIADYNLFWINVRENAEERVEAFGNP
jgi:hypothetical protein